MEDSGPHDTDAKDSGPDVIVESSECEAPREWHWYTSDIMWKIVVQMIVMQKTVV